MIMILPEDAAKIGVVVTNIIVKLGDGIKRAEADVDIGEEYFKFPVIGYWVGDTMRIDVHTGQVYG